MQSCISAPLTTNHTNINTMACIREAIIKKDFWGIDEFLQMALKTCKRQCVPKNLQNFSPIGGWGGGATAVPKTSFILRERARGILGFRRSILEEYGRIDIKFCEISPWVSYSMAHDMNSFQSFASFFCKWVVLVQSCMILPSRESLGWSLSDVPFFLQTLLPCNSLYVFLSFIIRRQNIFCFRRVASS